MQSNLFPIAREGWQYLITLAILLVIFNILDYSILSFVTFIFILLTAYVFRNPERLIVFFEDTSILAPCDGTVQSITELNDPVYGYRVDIESALYDTAILRAPISGEIKSVKRANGCKLPKSSKLYNDLSENIELVFVDNASNQIKVVHQLKETIFPLFIDLSEKATLFKSSRYGLANNASTSLYLPKNFRFNISIGNNIKASESLIGYFS